MRKLIGITGLARSGKDTLAAHLVQAHGYSQYKMAGPLKQLLADRFGLSMDEVDSGDWRDKPNEQFGHKSNQCGNHFSLRSWMQWLGTEASRHVHGEDCWLNVMERHWHMELGAGMVVSDVRFDNEAQRVRTLGGVVICVTRPGIARVEAHVSEKGVSKYLIDHNVRNDSDIPTFLRHAELALGL
jgi:hypothetical protein